MLIDFVGIFLHLFSFLPAPVAGFVLRVVAVCSFLLIIQLITKIKNLIPFI